MRKTMLLLISAALLTGTALTGSAVARDRSDRGELTATRLPIKPTRGLPK
jgi:hypothetical protein